MRKSTYSLLKQTEETIVVRWLKFLVNFQKEKDLRKTRVRVH